MKKKITLLSLAFICLFGQFYAQVLTGRDAARVVNQSKKVIMSELNTAPSYIALDDYANIPSGEFSAWIKSALKMNAEDAWEHRTSLQDELGYTHTRYTQTYKGLKVEGGHYISHVKDGRIISANGEFFNNLNIDVDPAFDEAFALHRALENIAAKKYKWELPEEERALKQIFEDPDFTYQPKGELVITPTDMEKQAGHVLAYKFDIYAHEPMSRDYVFVDAKTGEVVRKESRIWHADEVGTANTKYSGQQTITADKNGSSYRLRETGRGKGIETLDLKNSTSYGGASDFIDADNIWHTADDNGATDVHWGTEKTYDYYLNTFNFNSIDNKGYKLVSYVHYGNSVVNAWWDGSKLTYGDGGNFSGTQLNVMVAMDVIAHEVTHGFTTTLANFQNSGQTAALGEGYSDIFGVTIDRYARPNLFNWRVGEDLTSNGKGIRNLENPSEFNMPDTYQGTNYGGGGHIDQGVLAFWYYLLVEGGSGTNDNNDTYNVTAIGMDKAAAIAFRTCAVYLGATSKYSDAKTYSIQAAEDLYGNCSPEVIACTNAMYAVGLGTEFQSVPMGAVNFSASKTSLCGLPATVTFTNTTTGSGGSTWDFGDGNASSDFNASHAYTSAGTYTVKLTAAECGGANTDTKTQTNYITINLSGATPIANGANVCGDQTTSLSATAKAGGGIMWFDEDNNLVQSGSSFATPSLPKTTTYYVVETQAASSVFGGPADNTFGAGGNFQLATQYMKFDVNEISTLVSVKVYATGAGDRTIEYRNSSGTVLASKTVNIPDGESRVTLDFALTPGTDYQLGVSGAMVDLYRNSAGPSYPYDVNGIVSITSSSATVAGYYYFFYDWEVKGAPCTGEMVPVVVTQTQEATITQNGNILTATQGTSYQWYRNGTLITGATNQSYTITQAGDYHVVVTGGGCSTTSETVSVYLTGVMDEAIIDEELLIYPNPAEDDVYLSFNTKENTRLKVDLMNVLGELVVSGKEIQVNGAYQQKIDLTGLSSGIYFLTIQKNDTRISKKIIKE